MNPALILFARRPRLGRVKTRLAATIGDAACLELYRAFLLDGLQFLSSIAAEEDLDAELCTDGPWDDRAGVPLPAGVRRTEQGEGDLGRRMERAFARSRKLGRPFAIIIGGDVPTLPRAHVRRAVQRLQRREDPVVVPSDDGGYVLIGMGAPRAELFRNIRWGEADVLARTRLNAEAAGIRLRLLDSWYDVDDAESLCRLKAELRTAAGRRRCPHTARVLGLPG